MSHSEARELRELIGLSQVEVASGTGLNPSRLCLYERGFGDLRPEELKALRRFLLRVMAKKAARFKEVLSQVEQVAVLP